MKKVAILDKSTLSRHFSNEPENSQLKNNNLDNDSNKFSPKNGSNTFGDINSQNESLLTAQTTTCYNSHLSARSATSKPAQPTSLVVLPNSEIESRRHMYSKAADRSAAINDRIERMALKWTSLPNSPISYDDLSHPTHASQVNHANTILI